MKITFELEEKYADVIRAIANRFNHGNVDEFSKEKFLKLLRALLESEWLVKEVNLPKNVIKNTLQELEKDIAKQFEKGT